MKTSDIIISISINRNVENTKIYPIKNKFRYICGICGGYVNGDDLDDLDNLLLVKKCDCINKLNFK
jgi:hypothetical protein